MAHYVIHDAEGSIIRVGSCPDEYLEKQVMADHEILLPHVQAEAHHKVNVETKEIITEGTYANNFPAPKPFNTNTSGISDERLRAMIYSVLKEIEAEAKNVLE